MKNINEMTFEAFLAAHGSLQPKKIVPDEPAYTALEHKWGQGRYWEVGAQKMLLEHFRREFEDRGYNLTDAPPLSDSAVSLVFERADGLDEGYSFVLYLNFNDYFDVALIQNPHIYSEEFFGGMRLIEEHTDVDLVTLFSVVLRMLEAL